MSQRFKVGEAPWEIEEQRQVQTTAIPSTQNQDRFSTAESLLQGVGQGLTLGYLNELQAGLAAALDKDLTYEQALKGFRGRDVGIQAEDPSAYGGGTAAGGFVGSFAVPGGALARGATGIGKIARAAGTGALVGGAYNPGEVEGGLLENLQARGQNALTGAVMSGVGQGVSRALAGGKRALKQGREALALKLAGGRKAHFKELPAGAKRADMVKFMEKEGMLSPGQSFETVNKKAAQIRNKTGKQIGDVYESIQTDLNLASTAKPQIAKEIADTNVDARDVAARILNRARKEFRGQAGGDQVINAVKREVKNLKKISPKGSPKKTPVKSLLKYRESVDDSINWNRDPMSGKAIDPAGDRALKLIRKVTKEEVDNRVKSLDNIIKKYKLPGVKDRAKELSRLNDRYSKASRLKRISDDRVAAEDAKANIGLLETIAGTGYAGAQIMQGEDPAKAIGKGLVGALALRQGRKYGPGIGYKTIKGAENLSGLASGLGAIPPATYLSPWLQFTQER